MNRPVACSAIVLALAFASIPAEANIPPRQLAVPYARVSLIDPAALQDLDRCIHDAATLVCGSIDYRGGMGIAGFVQARFDREKCIARAVGRSRAVLADLQHR